MITAHVFFVLLAAVLCVCSAFTSPPRADLFKLGIGVFIASFLV